MKMSVEQFCPQHTFVETKSQEVVASILSGSNVEQVLFLTATHYTSVYAIIVVCLCQRTSHRNFFARCMYCPKCPEDDEYARIISGCFA